MGIDGCRAVFKVTVLLAALLATVGVTVSAAFA